MWRGEPALFAEVARSARAFLIAKHVRPSVRSFTIATLVACASHGACAQGLGSERSDLQHLTGDVWSAWSSPVRVDRKELGNFALAGAAFAVVFPHDSTIAAWMATHRRSLFMRALAPMTDSAAIRLNRLPLEQYLLPLATLTYVAGRLSHDASLRDAGLGCVTAHLSATGFRELGYYLVARSRPSVTADPTQISFPGGRDWNEHAFVAGHVANAMSCASFLAHRFHSPLGAVVVYGYSTAIGLGRMADRWHWASDTVAGALLGYVSGRFVAKRQLGRLSNQTSTAATLFSASWRVTF